MKKVKKEDSRDYSTKKKGGCVKPIILMVLLLLVAYCGLHIYFLWQPAGASAEFNKEVMKLEVSGYKVFPAIQDFDTSKIAGRDEIQNGQSIEAPNVTKRLESAISQGYPITFREEEINAWFNERLKVNQKGAFASQVKAKNVWVNFKKDEIELIIERELAGTSAHMTSMFMNFDRTERGFSITRNASHIGQVRAPGGFARLIMPAFNNLADELSEEMKLYETEGGKVQIYDIEVEEGQITLDPRRPDQRG